MDRRHISEEYTEIGHDLIENEPELAELKEYGVTIIFLASDHEKKKGDKLVLGQCEKVSEKYKWGIPCEFTVTVFEPNVEGFTDDQIRILLFHELLHIGFNEKSGEPFVRAHDLEDFKVIIDRYGTHWADPPIPEEDLPF